MQGATALLLSAINLTMLAGPAVASDSQGGFALHGIGAQTCQQMLREMRPQSAGMPAAAPAFDAPAHVLPAAPGAPVATAAGVPGPHVATAAGTAAPTSPAAPAPSPDAGPFGLSATMRPILTSWILGYLTASDRLVKDTFDATPVMSPEALTAMIIGVCQKYPDARVETVANTVLGQLATARVLHELPVIETSADDRVVPIRKATLIAVQTALLKNKLTREPADGNFGVATEAALKSFQKAQNLPQTGLPDPATVVRLLVEMPSKAAAK